ncbi:MAG: tetratricopeptide repeat protein [Epulopiscium sp.]|nr:tetratricopeptide repeat protein [Candidatus Epulonipiscium sp.]
MICVGCQREIQDNLKECPYCQFDIDSYNRIKSLSAKFYNKGLEQANNRELSYAIESLSKAVGLDKTNVDARNLLGLVYFEIGEVGLALTEWVISSNFKREDNLALEYIDKIQKNTAQLEAYNDSIKMFNQSLEYIKQKSEDLAIIQLKKALQINPNYVNAHCLLAACYMNEKENDKALSHIEKALQIDISNSNAIRYFKMLKGNFSASISRTIDRRPATINIKRKSISKATGTQKGQILGFLAGVICSFAVIFILIIPDKTNDLNQRINELNTERQKLEEKINTMIMEKNEEINNLKEENKNLIETNTQLQQKQAAIEQGEKINQAKELYNNRKYDEAASVLYSVDEGLISQEIKASYEELRNKVFPPAAKIHYDRGRSSYSKGDYDNSRAEFEKSLLYEQNANYSDNALYYIGRIYEQEQDLQKAKELYNQVIERYSGTDGASSANKRLRNLE